MKRKYLLLLFSSFTLFLQAQNVNYKTLKDTPEDAANLHINFEILQVEAGYKNLSGANFNLGLNSVYHYKNKMGGEATFRKSYLSLGESGHTQFGAGVFYNFASKTKVRSQKVVLDTKSYSSGGKKYTQTSSINVPGSILKSYGVRFGMDYVSEFLDADLKYHGFEGDYQYQTTGIYIGFLNTKQMNLLIDTDKYGTAATRFIRRYYLDGVIYPTRKINSLPGEVAYTGSVIGGIFGWRAGVEFLCPEPRKVHKNAMYSKVEIGMRPLDGIYVMVAVGLSFKRKLKGSNAYTPYREKE